MVWCLRVLNPFRSSSILAAVALALLWTAPADAQYAASCPPPKKFAAGACVTTCPAGYEDQGRVCVYRNMAR